MNEKKIPLPKYIVGHEFTEKLKEVTGCATFSELSEMLNVPKATFSAWNLHERTSHEVIVRVHLALGVPVETLAFGTDVKRDDFSGSAPAPYLVSDNKATNPQHQTVILQSFCLTNGQLIETGEVPYPLRRVNSFGLDSSKVIEVETNEAIYLLDKSTTDAVAGKYLIDVDGRLSINHVQRLPGKKLAIAFGDSTIEVSEHDIKVLGRVAVTLKKD
ncbi:phage repressor protein CI [Vibrio parahaemolyticus]